MVLTAFRPTILASLKVMYVITTTVSSNLLSKQNNNSVLSRAYDKFSILKKAMWDTASICNGGFRI